ncbi:MAG TPA: Gfo/Idh/MocA family oxidoreductase [Candidatus Limnocylindrales bacterium]
MGDPVRIGMLGSGFIADFYLAGARLVADAAVVANYSRSAERGAALAARYGIARTYDTIDALCAADDVQLVIVALPNHLHLEAVRAATAHGRAVVCTKPLGRNAAEAAEMVRLVRAAGVMGGYAENIAFSPDLGKMREIVDSGAIGRILSIRAREGHSGPHAAHFWDADTAGGGALLDMGCHGIEEVRILVGKDVRVSDVFAWGATLVHGDKTTGDDNAIALLRLEDGRVMTIEASWSAKGGLEGRTEISGTGGRIVTDTLSTSIRAFLETPAGYLAEKTDADTGWVFPIADEARVHGYDAQIRHFVEAFRGGTRPSETFEDGYVVNSIIDAAYRSMRSGRWEPVALDPEIAAA